MRYTRHERRDVAAKVGRDAFQAADGDGFSIDASAPAGRLARSVASAAQYGGEHVGRAVEHVGVGVTALRNEADIFGDVRVRRTCPLAVYDSVKVIRRVRVCRVH
jgi:hypothetical protein